MSPAQAKVAGPLTSAQQTALASAVCSCNHRLTDHLATPGSGGHKVYDGHCTAVLVPWNRNHLAQVCPCRGPR